MAVFIANIAVLLLYFGLIFQFQNPSSEYVSWIENYASLYAIFSTLGALVISAMVIATTLMKTLIKNKELTDKEKKMITKLQEAKLSGWRMSLWINFRLIINSLFAVFAYVILGYAYLPLVMILSNGLAVWMFSDFKEIANVKID